MAKLFIYYRRKSMYIYLSFSLPAYLPFLLIYSTLFYSMLFYPLYLSICLSLYRCIYFFIPKDIDTTDTTTYMIHRPKRVALPTTTTDTTTYMIHRPKRVALPRTTTDTTTYMIHRPKCVALATTTTDTTTYMIHRPKRVALPTTTTDTTTYMIHRPKRVETSKGPQPTRQLTWSIAKKVWQPPNDHNWHDNLHDPSPKTCGTPNDHNRHDNLHDPSPKTCGNLPTTTSDTTTYMIHRPKRVALPTTTTNTTTYMIHRPKRVATSQRPQPTQQLTWSIAQNVWQPPKDHNRHDTRCLLVKQHRLKMQVRYGELLIDEFATGSSSAIKARFFKYNFGVQNGYNKIATQPLWLNIRGIVPAEHGRSKSWSQKTLYIFM